MAPLGAGVVLAIGALIAWGADAPGWVVGVALALAAVLVSLGARAIALRIERSHGGEAMDHNGDWAGVPFRGESSVEIGSGKPFKKQPLPKSGTLPGGFSHVFYKEFDTIEHPDEWRQFLYDPLSSLDGHGVLAIAEETAMEEGRDLDSDPLLVHIAIYKLTEAGASPSPGGSAPTIDSVGEMRRRYRVVTTVVNHEEPLNPRIGMASVLI